MLGKVIGKQKFDYPENLVGANMPTLTAWKQKWIENLG